MTMIMILTVHDAILSLTIRFLVDFRIWPGLGYMLLSPNSVRVLRQLVELSRLQFLCLQYRDTVLGRDCVWNLGGMCSPVVVLNTWRTPHAMSHLPRTAHYQSDHNFGKQKAWPHE